MVWDKTHRHHEVKRNTRDLTQGSPRSACFPSFWSSMDPRHPRSCTHNATTNRARTVGNYRTFKLSFKCGIISPAHHSQHRSKARYFCRSVRSAVTKQVLQRKLITGTLSGYFWTFGSPWLPQHTSSVGKCHGKAQRAKILWKAGLVARNGGSQTTKLSEEPWYVFLTTYFYVLIHFRS